MNFPVPAVFFIHSGFGSRPSQQPCPSFSAGTRCPWPAESDILWPPACSHRSSPTGPKASFRRRSVRPPGRPHRTGQRARRPAARRPQRREDVCRRLALFDVIDFDNLVIRLEFHGVCSLKLTKYTCPLDFFKAARHRAEKKVCVQRS